MLAVLAFLLAADPATDLADAVKKLVQVFSAVESEAAEPVDSGRALYGGAIPGMLRGLDPHSIFLDPDQYQQLQEMNNAAQKGFGSIVSILPGRVIVLQTMQGTPSARSGLSPGDEIVAVNHYPLMGLEPEQLIQLLSESRRQVAKITVRRANTPRLLEFTLTPEAVASPSVDRAFLLKPGVAFVRVQNFEARTGAELRVAIEKLGGAKLTGLVLDLRNNPGGVVEAALESASLFLKPGQRILSVRGRTKKEEEVKVPDDAKPYEFPVSVLINAKTASAAEIVSAALQDHKRARIVGEHSFGKGLVQSVYPLSDKTGVALTVAFYYSPNGRNIQRPLKDVQLASETNASDRGGVTPDVTVGPESFTRLRAVLDASGVFTNFATETLRTKNVLSPTGEFDLSLLDDFRVWLSERKIQPSVSEWSGDSTWIRSRLKQELHNQAFSVEKGDEVEAQRDPQTQRAVDELRQPL